MGCWWRHNCIYYRKMIRPPRVLTSYCCCTLHYINAQISTSRQHKCTIIWFCRSKVQKSRCWQSCIPSGGSGTASFPGHLHALAPGPFLVSPQPLLPSSHLQWVTPTLLSLSYKDLCDCTGPAGWSRITSHRKILNSVPSAKSPVPSNLVPGSRN